ncbi:MAG TPA: protein phosphatase 2C domain-containing protein, partial [Agromyces sp.]
MTVAEDIAAGRLRWASEPRLGGSVNEDRVGMSREAVWVLDGAGTPAGVSSCCDKDAAWYVERIDAALNRQLEQRDDAPLVEILAAAIADVQHEHAAGCAEPTSGRGPSSTVAIARRSGSWLDTLVLGDSTILLDHGTHITTIRDTRLAAIAPELRRDIKTAIAAGHGYRQAEHEHRRAELVHAERQSRNRDGGYWIAADDPTAATHALTARYPIGPVP